MRASVITFCFLSIFTGTTIGSDISVQDTGPGPIREEPSRPPPPPPPEDLPFEAPSVLSGVPTGEISKPYQNVPIEIDRFQLENSIPDNIEPLAEAVFAAIGKLSFGLSDNVEAMRELDEGIFSIDEKLDQLEAQRLRALAEIKAGKYCSRCKNLKSQIEAHGETFEEHLNRVQGEAHKKTPAEIEQEMRLRENVFKDRKKQLINRQLELQYKRGDIYKETKQMWNETQRGISLWRTLSDMAINSKRIHFADEMDRANKDKNRAKDFLERTRKLKTELMNKKDRDLKAIEIVQNSEKMWEATIKRKDADLKEINTKLTNVILDHERHEDARYKTLLQTLKKTEPFAQMQASILKYVPKLKIPLAGSSSLEISPEALGFTFKFGKVVAAGFEVGHRPEEMTMEMKGWFQLFENIKLGMKRTQNWGRFGPVLRDDALFEIKPPKGMEYLKKKKDEPQRSDEGYILP